VRYVLDDIEELQTAGGRAWRANASSGLLCLKPEQLVTDGIEYTASVCV
jgi:hypothetical protein